MSIPDILDPLELFEPWLDEAIQADDLENAISMTLATVDENNQPHARVVLLKDFDKNGFVFYTNAESAKGRELTKTPKAALCFYWIPLGKQVRIAGDVAPVSDEEADAYFASRPRDSQLGAWASLQSSELDDRATLEARFVEAEERYNGQEVPRPPHWKGYRVAPQRIEFWLKAPNRLHHRRVYTRHADGSWSNTLIYP